MLGFDVHRKGDQGSAEEEDAGRIGNHGVGPGGGEDFSIIQ